MLPWPDGVGVANLHRLTGKDRSYYIRYQSVVGPVTTTDDIAGPGCSNGHAVPVIINGIKEGGAISSRNKLGTPFAVGVWIIPPHWLVLTVTPDPLTIFIDLIGSHIDHRLDRRRIAYGFQQVNSPHDIGCICFDRDFIGIPHQ